MGRASQIFWFLNEDPIPSTHDAGIPYTAIGAISPGKRMELKRMRRELKQSKKRIQKKA